MIPQLHIKTLPTTIFSYISFLDIYSVYGEFMEREPYVNPSCFLLFSLIHVEKNHITTHNH